MKVILLANVFPLMISWTHLKYSECYAGEGAVFVDQIPDPENIDTPRSVHVAKNLQGRKITDCTTKETCSLFISLLLLSFYLLD